jgi:thiol-disulfide isomerase/thioredoxin
MRPLAFAVLLLVPLAAQTPKLDKLRADFEQQRRELVRSGKAGPEQQRKLLEGYATAVEAVVQDGKGTERIEAALLLAEVAAGLGDTERRSRALQAVDAASAPPLLLARAADVAMRHGRGDLKKQWVTALLGKEKDAPREQRFEIGKLLLTRLHEVKEGERVFDALYQASKDDEARAEVLWQQALATREREDVEEDAFEAALTRLAASLPATRFGSIGKDRLRARQLRPGAEAIQLTVQTADGKTVATRELVGKVVLLEFWASWAGPSERIAPQLAKMRQRFGDKLALLSVSVDEDLAACKQRIQKDGREWPQACDGRGFQTDAALRYGVESVPWLLLIGKDGKVAAMNLFPVDEAGGKETAEAIEAAAGK